VVGTGEKGLVTEADVRTQADRSGRSSDLLGDDVESIPLEGVRRRIAERMSLSRRTAADVTTVIDVEMGAVARVRKSSGLSYTSYIAWAVAHSLVDFPDLNSSLVDDHILRHRKVQLGVAVALDDGLVVPVVRDAHAMTVEQIEAEVEKLAAKARAGKIRPEDMAGATFTLTNSGTFGSLFFTPIINLPEVAILGVGRVADVPIVRDGQVVAGKVMYLCLSYDHRAVDGAQAVTFLASVKHRLEAVETEIKK
jgi:2-oxoglutarate dehydrogenase E2 component (dihydrolipoamide succinyltransferase)